MTVLARAERLFMRFVMLFLTIHRTPCDEPECRCKNHEVVGVSQFGVYTLIFLVLGMFLFSCWTSYR